MTNADILRAVRALLVDRAKWTQGAAARGPDSLSVQYDDPTACCWCLMGACHKVTPPHIPVSPVLKVLDRAVRGSPVFFNDHSTHDEVLQLLDRAIEMA